MTTSMILAGLGIAGFATALRHVARVSAPLTRQLEKNMKEVWSMDYKYYRGGFKPKMTKHEASLILGVGPSANQKRYRAAHRRIMLINHPDKGGSPYLAAKINQAKDILDGAMKSL